MSSARTDVMFWHPTVMSGRDGSCLLKYHGKNYTCGMMEVNFLHTCNLACPLEVSSSYVLRDYLI